MDKTGKRFGKLVVKKRLGNYKNGRTYYICECDCGHKTIVMGSNLGGKYNHTQSCGCLIYNEKYKKDLNITDKIYSVYIHIFPNNKVYIGITSQNVDDRWKGGHGYDSQALMKKAINKYGWDNIIHEVIKSNLSFDEACEMEKHYIKQYKSTNRKYGYNVTSGGDCGNNLVRPVIQYYNGNPVNYFKSLSDASYYLNVSITVIKSWAKNGCTNKKYSFDVLTPIYDYDLDDIFYSDINKRYLNLKEDILKIISHNTIDRNKKTCRKVNQYDLNGKYIKTFNSIKEAINETGAKSITGVLNNNHISKSSNGFMWKYYDGNINDIEPYHANKIGVVQIDIHTKKIINKFDSIQDVKRIFGINISHISDVCKGKRKSAHGYIWKYADEIEENNLAIAN